MEEGAAASAEAVPPEASDRSKMKNKKLIIILIIAAVIGGMFSWYVGTRNRLVTLEEKTAASWAEIDNQLQRRSDLIPNLVSTVKGYAKHESDVFSSISEARARLAGSGTVAEKADGYNRMQSALGRLLAIAESYPQLKSDANFRQLQDELAGTENRIAVARKRYNDNVRSFNTQIKMFPASFVASQMGFEKMSYFEVSESAKALPKVEF